MKRLKTILIHVTILYIGIIYYESRIENIILHGFYALSLPLSGLQVGKYIDRPIFLNGRWEVERIPPYHNIRDTYDDDKDAKIYNKIIWVDIEKQFRLYSKKNGSISK